MHGFANLPKMFTFLLEDFFLSIFCDVKGRKRTKFKQFIQAFCGKGSTKEGKPKKVLWKENDLKVGSDRKLSV